MWNHTNYFPILLEIRQLFSKNNYAQKYTEKSFKKLGNENPLELLMALMTMHIGCFEYSAHYKEVEKDVQKKMIPICKINNTQEIKDTLAKITNSMPSWKLLLLQRQIIRENNDILCQDNHCQQTTLDIDSTTLTSFAKKREGAKVGLNTKYKGKPCYQLSLSFLSKVFIDCKLSPGNANPKNLFRKLVARARYQGCHFTTVRADTAYGSAENILFLQKFSLHYAIGVSSSLTSVKQGIKSFKSRSHQKGSPCIINIHQGLSAFDLGQQTMTSKDGENFTTRIIVCCRIQRKKKKNGRWRIKRYYYAITTDFLWSVSKVVKFYHQRQKIENGIKELKYHYALNRMVHRNLQANEFYITSKILALTMVKTFCWKYLPKRLRHLRLKTLVRKIIAVTLKTFTVLRYANFVVKVEYNPKSLYLWHFKRIIEKLVLNHSSLQARKLAA